MYQRSITGHMPAINPGNGGNGARYKYCYQSTVDLDMLMDIIETVLTGSYYLRTYLLVVKIFYSYRCASKGTV